MPPPTANPVESRSPSTPGGGAGPLVVAPADGVETTAWFAVWTRSRHEVRVFNQLETKGIEAFVPTITRWSRWKDRKKRIDWPLFPGYCFA